MKDPVKNPWTVLKRKIAYDNKWIQLREHDVLNPARKEGIYGVVHFKNYAIGILPIDENGNIYLVGQYRYPFDEYTWEIPEGGGNIEIDPLESAKRELLEEVGLKAGKWTLIQEIQLSNSITDEYGYIYLAQELTQHDPEPDEDEDIAIKKIPFSEAYDMLLNGQIKDSLTVAALLKGRLLGF